MQSLFNHLSPVIKLCGLIWILPASFGTRAQTSKIRIGAIFPNSHERRPENLNPAQIVDSDRRSRLAINFVLFALNQQNSNDYVITNNVLEYSDGPNQVFQITKQVCAQLSLGVAAIVTSYDYDIIKSICSSKYMVHLHVGNSVKESTKTNSDLDYTLSFNPSVELWNSAVADIVVYREWKNLALVYCDNIQDVQSLVQILNKQSKREVLLLNAAPGPALLYLLRLVKKREMTKVIINCNDYQLLLDLLRLVLENEMDRAYHYLVYGMASLLVLKQNHYTFGHLNITTLSLLTDQSKQDGAEKTWKTYVGNTLERESLSQVQDGMIENTPSYAFSTDIALMYDALDFYDTILMKLREAKPLRFNHRSIPCDTSNVWLFGPDLVQALKNASYNGVTGSIKFNKWGQRDDVVMDVVSLSYTGLKKIGEWKSGMDSEKRSNDVNLDRLRINEYIIAKKQPNSYHNQTLKVTIIVESPYVFKNISADENGNPQTIYTGYCIDLLNHLAEDLQFFYNITEVQDGQYGSYVRDKRSWNGMIGELLRGEADMAVAPLTINYDRERAVKFTKPYMSLGIGILYRTPKPGTPSLFGFLNPLSVTIWVLIIVAYLAVSFIMFCIARLSPYEWQESEVQDNQAMNMENDFGLLDSLWFGMGTLMQQGSDISPRSISTRLLAGVWWFFTLILISSYTANLAAFLTVTRMESDIASADDLAAQIRIQYGTLKSGATATFFKNSMLPTFAKMWHYMNETPEVFVNSNEQGIHRVIEGNYAYLMESSTMEYIVNGNCNLTQVGGLLDTRGYGIATTTSKLRDDLSVSILKLQENGVLDKLKHKWWREEEAKNCPGNDATSATQSLTVSNLGGAFVFLCCGATVAVFAAIIEFCFYSYSNAKSKKKRLARELKLGFATICSCHNRIMKTSFFDKVSLVDADSSSDTVSCVCCSCLPAETKLKPIPSRCGQINCSSCRLISQSGGSLKSRRYCDGFSSMVETVLTDHIPPSTNGCLSVVADCVASSLNSSKDRDAGMIAYPNALSRQACFQDSTLESDLVSSSFSLPGGSPNNQRFKADNYGKRKSLSYFDSIPMDRQRNTTTSRSTLKREPSELRRWKYANSTSLRYASQCERRPSDFFLRNSSLCLESEKEQDSPTKNSFMDLNEFRNLKQTVM